MYVRTIFSTQPARKNSQKRRWVGPACIFETILNLELKPICSDTAFDFRSESFREF